ncbi:xanthine dehydrogenase small subunit [Crenobacter cavernae]|uniref:Xanthine dehydrogenase small subunit n=1 Tax=Crenobacter cavernae TaxID=2290923 RepID=A0ABY0FGF8_9NEIS|nr:xanthine dehydrogenase small subunit [Crenobacter cavernae]RXZ45471.1 xanthine dehydrogenase small subunit [Crenobacter cavernae]
MGNRRTIRFLLNGELREVVPTSPTQSLLTYLREDERATGTKEGCAEGDCGACTVTEAELTETGEVRFRSINACIRFLPTFDGRAIWTVEGIASPDGTLHPAQQAMVDHHGSQCGFCTPGFVMSMYTMYQNGESQPSRERVLDCLSGNLCRCTGYRPIVDAAMHMGDYPQVKTCGNSLAEQLKAIRPETLLEVSTEAGNRFYAPATVEELAALYEANPDAVILAGGTDVGLWVTKHLMDLKTVIYIGGVQGLKNIEQRDGGIEIGAAVLLNDAFPVVVEQYPEMEELWKRFSSTPIRNSGTFVGNLANGSPIGDNPPPMIAVGAKVVLRKGDRRREMALEDLYLAYRKQAREEGEFVESVIVPLRRESVKFAVYKLSKRYDQDISAVCAAFAFEIENGRVKDARIAYGGMAATPKRATAAEAVLNGASWDEAAVQKAMEAMDQDYQPMTDMRATKEYRMTTAKNLVYRFYLETTGEFEASLYAANN